MSYRFTGLAGYGTRRSVIDNDAYYLYDTFENPRAAGAVNGTLAEPVGGARFVTDTNSKISTSSGLLSFATGHVAGDGIWWPVRTQVQGMALLFTLTPTASNGLRMGWYNGQVGTLIDGFALSATDVNLFANAGILLSTYGAYAAGELKFAIVNRKTAGNFYFHYAGGVWKMLYNTTNSSLGNRYPGIYMAATAEVATFDNLRNPKQLYIPVPLQSDGMSAATTDGLGNVEANGIVGSAYTDYGTWGVAAGVRSCSVLGAGSLGSSILATSSRDVFIEVNITRSAGSAGIRARQADDINYIQCRHDGTSVIVSQVVAGTSTTLSTTAVAYSAGATMKFIADGLTYRAFYNSTAAGSGVLPDTTSTNHGVMTNHIGATFDNLVIWARSGYEGLDQL